MLHSGFFGLGGAAAGGGGSYPNLTLTSPTFATGKFGQGLSGGTATASGITVGSGCGLGFWWKDTENQYATVLQAPGFTSFGTAWNAPEIDGSGNQACNIGTAPSTASTPNAINDGVFHWVYIDRAGTDINLYVDNINQRLISGIASTSTNLSLTIVPGNLGGGVIDHIVFWNTSNTGRAAIPGSATARDANTVVIWPLDGNGTGS